MAKKKVTRLTQAESAEDSAAGQTIQDILAIATEEFALKGLSGARVDEIAERTQTSKRMIYYYFGGKDELYRAVLAKVYGDIRTREAQLNLDALTPVEAIRRLVELTFDYDESHVPSSAWSRSRTFTAPSTSRKLTSLRNVNASVIKTLEDIIRRGQAEGVFKNDVDPVDLHLFISAFCFFRVSNQHTLGVLFGRDLSDAKLRKKHKKMIVDAVLALLGARDE